MSEPDNLDRAAWALNAVNGFGLETYCGRPFSTTVIEQPNEGDDAYTMCQDLIADILHLARQHGWDAEEMARKAVATFKDEVAEEESEPFRCNGCGRLEADCSADPCGDVIADRGEL